MLNGLSPHGHQATYGRRVFEIVEATADRIVKVAALHGATLKRVAACHQPTTDDSQWGSHHALERLRKAAITTVDAASLVLVSRGKPPQPLQHAVMHWLNDGSTAARVLAQRIDRVRDKTPHTVDAATTLTERELRALAGNLLDVDPGPVPPPAAPARTPRSSPTRRGLERLAAAVVHAPNAARLCLAAYTDRSSPMSLASWRDLKGQAQDYLDATRAEPRRRSDHLEGASQTLTGETTPRDPQHAQAASELEYRSRVIRATETAAAIHDRVATVLRTGRVTRSEEEACAELGDLTKDASDTAANKANIKTREGALVQIGGELDANRRDHVEHAALLPDVDPTLIKAEIKRVLEPKPAKTWLPRTLAAPRKSKTAREAPSRRRTPFPPPGQYELTVVPRSRSRPQGP